MYLFSIGPYLQLTTRSGSRNQLCGFLNGSTEGKLQQQQRGFHCCQKVGQTEWVTGTIGTDEKKEKKQPLRKWKVRYLCKKKDMKINLLALLFIFFISCSNDDQPVDLVSLNNNEIQDYLAENNLQAEKSPSGLYYIIENEGTGERPTTTDQVRVVYKGYFTNGNVFDQSSSEGISINLQRVIRGWTEGITYFKEGGSGMLFIPSHLGYGPEDYMGIPGGSVLIFEINLIEVNEDAN